jgi:hypothetical protein
MIKGDIIGQGWEQSDAKIGWALLRDGHRCREGGTPRLLAFGLWRKSALSSASAGLSLDGDDAVDLSPLRRLDEIAVGNTDEVQGAVELGLPIMEEVPRRREVRRHVIGLLYGELQQ